MLEKIRETRLEINLDNIKDNIKNLKDYIGDTKLMAVLKSDSYSHGTVNILDTVLASGVDYLAVASLNEALEVRKFNKDFPLLILGFGELNSFDLIVENKISQTVYNLHQAELLNEAGKKLNTRAKLHIKINTGMNRLGFKPNNESLKLIKRISNLPYLELEGIFSHFSESEIEDKSFSNYQYRIFTDFVGKLEEAGLTFKIKHISNWAGAVDLPNYNLDMVRLGIPLFGVYSNYDLQSPKIPLKLSMKFRTVISNINYLEKGESVSYNRTFTTEKKSIIATLPVGYADGFFQELADKLDLLVAGKKVRVVGKVCMDQTMIDITDLENIKIGDEVILFGDHNQNLLRARDIATIGRRVPKVYFKDNKILKSVDYLLG